jgi:hypothetical protein
MASSADDKKEGGGFFSKLFGGKKKKAVPMRSGRADTWPVPYLSRLDGNRLQPGQSVVVRGFVTGENRFEINLSCGPKVDGDDDIPLHLSARMDEKKLVMNSRKGGEWGKEERVKIPFKVGQEFDLRIRAHDDKYEIFANHKEIHQYDHRQPLSSVSHIYVTGSVELFTCSWEGKYYSVPYEAGIPGNFYSGRKLYVSGEPEKGAKEFAVNLHAGNDIAFQFNVRFNEKAVVRNSKRGNEWGNEEREGKFPFDKKATFDLVIQCEDHTFKCIVDGNEFCNFAHRMSPKDIEKLGIEGDVELQGVHLK